MRLLTLTSLLSLLLLSFCAQKEAPSTTPVTPTPTTPTAPTTPVVTDTTKKLVWSDEFNSGTRPDTTKWAYNIGTGQGGWGNNESEYYTSDSTNARIENGSLVIEARKENKGGKFYTSARMLTQGKSTWTYGRFEIRAKLPKGLGTWPAIWMLGDNINTVGWPTCGEIDIMEEGDSTSAKLTAEEPLAAEPEVEAAEEVKEEPAKEEKKEKKPKKEKAEKEKKEKNPKKAKKE